MFLNLLSSFNTIFLDKSWICPSWWIFIFISLYHRSVAWEWFSWKESKLCPHHGHLLISSTKAKSYMKSGRLAIPYQYFAGQIWLKWTERKETFRIGVSKCTDRLENYDRIIKSNISISPLLHLLQSLQRFPWKWGHAPEQKLHPNEKNNNKIIKHCG